MNQFDYENTLKNKYKNNILGETKIMIENNSLFNNNINTN